MDYSTAVFDRYTEEDLEDMALFEEEVNRRARIICYFSAHQTRPCPECEERARRKLLTDRAIKVPHAAGA